jgi:hypothetical protein
MNETLFTISKLHNVVNYNPTLGSSSSISIAKTCTVIAEGAIS